MKVWAACAVALVMLAVANADMATRLRAKAGVLDAADMEWDVKPDGILVGAATWLKGKGQGHELLPPAALPASVDKAALMDGIRFPDLPQAKGQKPLGGVAFAMDFTAGEKPTANHNDAVFNTHFGCLQHWHSMAPSVEPASKGVPVANQIMFTNAEVKNIIQAQAKNWWSKVTSNKNNKAVASSYLGRLLHMLTDSFPQGHTVRNSQNVRPVGADVTITAKSGVLPSACGNIVYFQGYPAQSGKSAHGDNDHAPSAGRNKVLFDCAKWYAAYFVHAFDKCVTANQCSFPQAVFDSIYRLSDPTEIAGGSVDGFQGPAAGAGFTKKAVGGFQIWVPKSTKRNPKTGNLCPASMTGRTYGMVKDSAPGQPFSEFFNVPLSAI